MDDHGTVCMSRDPMSIQSRGHGLPGCASGPEPRSEAHRDGNRSTSSEDETTSEHIQSSNQFLDSSSHSQISESSDENVASSASPASPPTTPSYLIQQIELSLSGKICADTWNPYPLSARDFGVVRQYLEEDSPWAHKVRFDYFPDTQTFVLRMPGIQHEILSCGFALLVNQGLQKLCTGKGKEEAAFVKQILNLGTTAITNKTDIHIHCPDAQFRHGPTRYPRLVLEIAASQKSRELERLAYDYIARSGGEIRMMVALDLDYPRSKKVVLKTWMGKIERSQESTMELKISDTSQEIRTPSGQCVPGLGLLIAITDLARPDLVPESLRAQQLFISSEDICSFMEELERQEIGETDAESPPVHLKIPPSPTSPTAERLSDEDESTFDWLEGRDAERGEEGDPD